MILNKKQNPCRICFLRLATCFCDELDEPICDMCELGYHVIYGDYTLEQMLVNT